ncbi:hypothetical protein [Microvirga pakistanensis]|uniref:hypothetical protein n=1 Tax=Microvirga pakistanensis TaxID=1682650 RepID=UPI00106AFE0D|nr:hypothetical protein [Microvirga pakistanensis]
MGFDWEGIATAHAIGDARRDYDRLHAQATVIIQDCNAEILKQNQIIAQKNTTIAQQNEVIASLRQEIDNLKARLEIQILNAIGIGAQTGTLRAELAARDPNHRLFQQTGKVYPDGRKQTNLSLIYNEAFDTEAVKRGHRDPRTLRVEAE